WPFPDPPPGERLVKELVQLHVSMTRSGRARLQSCHPRQKDVGALAPVAPEFEEPRMEALTRLVTDSLARHGFDRPIDPRRLQWSRWFRCDSLHSLLVVPSKPGIFAIAEEIAALCGASEPRSRNPERSEGSPAANSHVGTAALGCPAEQRSTTVLPLGGAALQRCDSPQPKSAALAAEVPASKRMLA